MTVREGIGHAEAQLHAAGIAPARAEASMLMAEALGDTLPHLPTRTREELAPEPAARLHDMLIRRAAREPLAYILGWTEFMGLRFACDPRALIPRPDTETLVETVVERLRDVPSPLIAELGTGTGCIAISLAHLLPSARLIATDLSPDALALAQENAAALGVAERITFLQGPYAEPLAPFAASLTAIVSNPPYIPSGDIAALEPEVAESEPRLALDGGPDGLTFYHTLLPPLASFPSLRLVALEFGLGQEQALPTLLRQHLPQWSVEVIPDLSHLPRVALAQP
jgi:release factor glutamine methyltransferase